jgi:hypothetical protein
MWCKVLSLVVVSAFASSVQSQDRQVLPAMTRTGVPSNEYADAHSSPRTDPQPGAVTETVYLRRELLARMGAIDSMRIVMHAREPASDLAGQLASLLSALGAKQVERRLVDVTPASPQVRYFHPADRKAGQVVADALGLVFDEVAVRDFVSYQPAPDAGLIEVWLQ